MHIVIKLYVHITQIKHYETIRMNEGIIFLKQSVFVAFVISIVRKCNFDLKINSVQP